MGSSLDDDFWEEINRLVNMPDADLIDPATGNALPRGIVSAPESAAPLDLPDSLREAYRQAEAEANFWRVDRYDPSARIPTWLRRARPTHFLTRCQWCRRRMLELLVPHHAISVCSYCDGPSVCHCPKHGGTSPVA